MNFPRVCGQCCDRSGTRQRTIWIVNSRIAVAAARLRWNKVVVIKDVEHFRPELDVERFRNTLYWKILQDGEVHIEKFWTGNRVTENAARREVGAIDPSCGRWCWSPGEIGALTCKRSRCRRKTVAI